MKDKSQIDHLANKVLNAVLGMKVDQYLEGALQSENGGEKVIGDAQNSVSLAVFTDGILRGQGYRAQNDHKHDEHVKDFLGHNPVNETSQPFGRLKLLKLGILNAKKTPLLISKPLI